MSWQDEPTEPIRHSNPTEPLSQSGKGPDEGAPPPHDGDGHTARKTPPDPYGVRAGAGKAFRAIGRGTAGGARLAGRGSRAGAQRARAFARSKGADESGLARLVELHFVNICGDAALTVSLAGTIFAIPTDEARAQVAQFLILTMAPFVLLAPFIGPLLDRFRQGRRWAIGTTLALRAFLCWVLASAVVTDSPWLFPAALGCLVASKAYGVTRAAAIPRLLPEGFTLVNANSRIALAGVAAMAVGGGLAGAVSRIGPDWSLRLAFVFYVVGTILAIRLPARVDSSVGEFDIEDTHPLLTSSPGTPPDFVPHWDGHERSSAERARPNGAQSRSEEAATPPPRAVRRRRFSSVLDRLRARVLALPATVRAALVTAMGGRLLTGFLTLFMAFLMREHPIPGYSGTLVLALVVGAAGAGNALGTVVGNAAKRQRPDRIASAAFLVIVAAALATALAYSLWTLLVLGLAAGLCSQVIKLSTDAIIQRDVAENVRTQVFAWSETVLQTAWVIGGGLGIALPLNPQLGFGVISGLLVAVLLTAVQLRRRTAA
ncbi:membrane protein [Knoellia sinensis KCTC 19936]|uniref:Membrane protein n=1 Tax=Knoellia sinensis KCTC 19936 TaxID=1385520 RepID=A0A0A0J0R4_9MICO|nr:MFS transporter [Knoellia sinensis]KGN30975.1 membrane protein [Knoellia sinensis KCTC 19936]